MSKISWISVNTQFQQTLEYKVTRTEVRLQDKGADFDELTLILDKSMFEIEKKASRTYEKDYDVQMDITVEMNLSKITVERTGYTFLDVLSDVGGIQGLLLSFCGLIVGIANYNNFDNYLASRLFKIKDKSTKKKDVSTFKESETTSSSSFMKPTKWLNVYEYIFDFVPQCLRKCKCCHCRKTREMRGMERAR